MSEQCFEKNIILAERYTKALLQTAKDNNIVSDIASELDEILNCFNTNSDIEAFFENPIIKIDDKKEVLSQAFKVATNEKLFNFLNVLVDKNRMFLFREIVSLYHKTLAKEANILEVEVQSVIELDADMNKQLVEKLEKITGKKIELIHKINKDIIGGLMLSYNGKVIDGSVKTQLKKLQMQLI